MVQGDSRATKTRERILTAALQIFNDEGLEKSSTNRIAAQLQISPGNLYYHFKNKRQIAEGLVLRVERRFDDIILAAPGVRAIDDFWLALHLVFESVHQYRFVFRDVEYLMRESQTAATRIHRITARTLNSTRLLCRALAAARVIVASEDEIDALALHVVFAATCWFNFTRLRPAEPHDESAGRAAYHVLTLFTPYLAEQARPYMSFLRSKYVA